MNWQMFWWEDFDELLRSCELFEGIFGYSGSLNPFTRDDIAQVTSIATQSSRSIVLLTLLLGLNRSSASMEHGIFIHSKKEQS